MNEYLNSMYSPDRYHSVSRFVSPRALRPRSLLGLDRRIPVRCPVLHSSGVVHRLYRHWYAVTVITVTTLQIVQVTINIETVANQFHGSTFFSLQPNYQGKCPPPFIYSSRKLTMNSPWCPPQPVSPLQHLLRSEWQMKRATIGLGLPLWKRPNFLILANSMQLSRSGSFRSKFGNKFGPFKVLRFA